MFVVPILYTLIFAFIVGSTNPDLQTDIDRISTPKPDTDYFGSPVFGCSNNNSTCGVIQAFSADVAWIGNVTYGIFHLPQHALTMDEFCFPTADNCSDGSFLSAFNIGMLIFAFLGAFLKLFPVLIDMVKAVADFLNAVIPF